MKKALLLASFLFALDVSSMSLSDYSENGVRLHIKNHAVGSFTLVPKEGGDIGIVERQIDKIMILPKKVIEAETMVSLRGKKDGSDVNRKVHLQLDGLDLLTFSFRLDPTNGRQLYLESVSKSESPASAGVGVFRQVGGGGITYQLVIEKDKKAIEMFESKQKMRFPVRSQERLQKIEIL